MASSIFRCNLCLFSPGGHVSEDPDPSRRSFHCGKDVLHRQPIFEIRMKWLAALERFFSALLEVGNDAGFETRQKIFRLGAGVGERPGDAGDHPRAALYQAADELRKGLLADERA